MCGIGLIVSGLCLQSNQGSTSHTQGTGITTDHLIEALKRRGPDNIGKLTVVLDGNDFEHGQVIRKNNKQFDNVDVPQVTLEFVAATLQLRGSVVISQPLVDDCKNVLAYNGEIYGGLPLKIDENDSRKLFESLQMCCSCACHTKFAASQGCSCIGSLKFGTTHISVPELLSSINGPWALVFWQEKSKTLWFGHDALGRRSLLVHWPSEEDNRLVFSSVSPEEASSSGGETIFEYWEELQCGIYSCSMEDIVKDCFGPYEPVSFRNIGWIISHPWESINLVRMVRWERSHVVPPFEFDSHMFMRNSEKAYISFVLRALKESVRKRTSNIFRRDQELMTCVDAIHTDKQMTTTAPVAVLFSGGLDSMILSSLLDQCLPPQWSIDLLNVSFEGLLAPDRISAIAGVEELSKVSPSRSWRLVEVDANLSSMDELHKHLLSLICPSNTHMDLNIGMALWLAARGHGWVKDGTLRIEYISKAPIVLVGSGADEQCAGYGRYRTKFKNGGQDCWLVSKKICRWERHSVFLCLQHGEESLENYKWEALNEEMKLDMQRLWKRNMGRDDRCIADHGKEARFPFLDEDVIRTLLDIPLWLIADLSQPSGQDCCNVRPNICCLNAKACDPVWNPHSPRIKSEKLW